MSNLTVPLHTPAGIAEAVRVFTASGHHTSGQIAVLMALAVIQTSDASEFSDAERGWSDGTPPRIASATVATVASYVRLTPATVQKHLRYWAERPATYVRVRRDNNSPFVAYFIGA